MLISVDQLEESAQRFDAIAETSSRDIAPDANEETLTTNVPPELTKGNIIGIDENLIKRKEMLAPV